MTTLLAERDKARRQVNASGTEKSELRIELQASILNV